MAATRRRTVLLGLGSALAAGSGPQGCAPAPPPGPGRDVVAAGQPAALLIWVVARERLAGWPHRPEAAALAALPALAAALPETGSLAGGDPAAISGPISAIKPRLVLDYGDAGPEPEALAGRMRARAGVDWRLINGSLTRIPEALRETGRLLDARPRGEALAETAAGIIERWGRAPPGPAFYYARGADGLETGFRGAPATEVLEGGGWTNVAEGSDDIGRVTLDQVAAWDPDTIVTLDSAFARAAARDPVWRWRRSGQRRGILVLPKTPFGWIDGPSSVNRLLGCAWLAAPHAGWMELTLLSQRLYGMAAAETPRPRWMR